MVSAWCLKFSVLAVIAIAGTHCAQPKLPWKWHNTNSFDSDGLTGPPRENKQFYILENEFKSGQTVYLNATPVDHDFRGCITFDYYLNVPENDGMKLVLTDTKSGTTGIRTVWARYGFQGDVWQSETIDVQVAKGQYLQFQVNTISGTVAIGQFQYDNTNAHCAFTAVNTDFEESPSNWNTDNVPANTFGPNVRDHSSNSGKGKVAHLLDTDSFNSFIRPLTPLKAGTKCFTFWYRHITQTNPVLANIPPTQIKVVLGDNDRKPIWASYNDELIEDEWLQVQVPLNITADGAQIKIQIESRNGQKEKGVLIDDIVFSNRPCPEPVSCDFETSICGWTNGPNNQQNWVLGRGRVEDRFQHKGVAVPTRVNTIYTDFTKTQSDKGVTLMSDLIPKKVDHCAKLYIMHNRVSADDVFMLEHLVNNETSSKRPPVWKLDTVKASQKASLDYNEEVYDIELKATQMTSRLALTARSTHPLSRFAVNAIHLTEGSCKSTTPVDPGQVKSKLNHEVLVVADELLKNSRDNVHRLIEFIKNDDPIKDACNKVLKEIDEALKQVEYNLKN